MPAFQRTMGMIRGPVGKNIQEKYENAHPILVLVLLLVYIVVKCEKGLLSAGHFDSKNLISSVLAKVGGRGVAVESSKTLSPFVSIFCSFLVDYLFCCTVVQFVHFALFMMHYFMHLSSIRKSFHNFHLTKQST